MQLKVTHQRLLQRQHRPELQQVALAMKPTHHQQMLHYLLCFQDHQPQPGEMLRQFHQPQPLLSYKRLAPQNTQCLHQLLLLQRQPKKRHCWQEFQLQRRHFQQQPVLELLRLRRSLLTRQHATLLQRRLHHQHAPVAHQPTSHQLLPLERLRM